MEEELYDQVTYCLLIRKDLDLSPNFYTYLMKIGALTLDERIYIREALKECNERKKRRLEGRLLGNLLYKKGNLGYIGFTQALYVTSQHLVLKSIS